MRQPLLQHLAVPGRTKPVGYAWGGLVSCQRLCHCGTGGSLCCMAGLPSRACLVHSGQLVLITVTGAGGAGYCQLAGYQVLFLLCVRGMFCDVMCCVQG